MGAFEYVAMDQAGKQSKGLLEGDTPKHVRQILRDRNMFPVSVTEVAQKEARRQRGFAIRRGMSPGELALITRQLASLSQSGLPLEEALLAVAQQNDQSRTKSILLGVRAKVMEGHALADGQIPQTPNFSTPDPELTVLPITMEQAAEAGFYLLNTFGFGGTNTVLVVEKRP